MDGWGEGADTPANAIKAASTPFVDSLYKQYPHANLLTCGLDVGLPEGQMGNSEVGHLNIGAGRVVYQDFAKINKAVADGTFQQNEVLQSALKYVKESGKNLHLIGLVSDGGVHSHQNHLIELCKVAAKAGVNSRTYIHAFTDGRDTDPHSGINSINEVEKNIASTQCKFASVSGRYYAMDRDKRWERIKLAYNAMVKGTGIKALSASEAIQHSYDQNRSDEFIVPTVITINDRPIAKIEDEDAVICFNFRTDRCREITMALTQQDFPEQNMKKLNLYYVTMTKYDDTFQNIHVMFEKQNLDMTLGEALSNADLKQLRISETEKYPHVTFFFSGGRETVFEGEKRIMIPSPKVATYDLKPSMSAYEVKDALIQELNNGEVDFVCLNFANADMVGHTGVFSAIVEAVETVDKCVKEVVEAGIKNGYSFIITSDHGNADCAINSDGSPNTAHTLNPVPWFLIDSDFHGPVKNGRLCDLAPTILHILGVQIPKEMDGKVLV